jgi:GNAT superfamily N-acetyltransferase
MSEWDQFESPDTAVADPWAGFTEPNERQVQMGIQKEVALRYARKSLLESNYPSTKAAFLGLGTQVASMVNRVTGDDLDADSYNVIGDAISQAASEGDAERTMPAIIHRGYRGVVQTLPLVTAATGTAGLFAGPAVATAAGIGIGTAQEMNQDITQGREAGLTGKKLASYTITEGVIEGATESLLAKFGLGGLEQYLGGAKGIAAKGIREGIRAAGFATLQEVPQEIVTEIGHAVAKKLYAVDNSDVMPKLPQIIADTTVQTLMTMGAASGPIVASKAAVALSPQAAPQTTQLPPGSVPPTVEQAPVQPTAEPAVSPLEQLQEIRSKGWVTKAEGESLGFTEEQLKNRSTRMTALDERTAQLEQETQDASQVRENKGVTEEAGQVGPGSEVDSSGGLQQTSTTGTEAGDTEVPLVSQPGKKNGYFIAPEDSPNAPDKPDASGWKLHLTVAPENIDVAREKLRELGITFKHEAGGTHEDGKDFTVYLGSKDKADSVANQINDTLGDLLADPQGDVLGDDMPMVGKVMGRFDAERGSEFHQYGTQGIPALLEDVKNNFGKKLKDLDYTKARQKLAAKYGEFFTGTKPTSEVTPAREAEVPVKKQPERLSDMTGDEVQSRVWKSLKHEDTGNTLPGPIRRMEQAPVAGSPGINVEPSYFRNEPVDDSKNVVARDEAGAPIGVLRVTFDKDGKPELLEVAVDPSRRRQGIATQLYEKANATWPGIDEASGKGGYTKEGKALAESRTPAPAKVKGPKIKPVPQPTATEQMFGNSSDEKLQAMAAALGIKETERGKILAALEAHPRAQKWLEANKTEETPAKPVEPPAAPEGKQQITQRTPTVSRTNEQITRDLEKGLIAKKGSVKVEETDTGWDITLPNGRTTTVVRPDAGIVLEEAGAAAHGKTPADVKRMEATGGGVRGATVPSGGSVKLKDGTTITFERATVLIDPKMANSTTAAHELWHLADDWGFFETKLGKRIRASLRKKFGSDEAIANARGDWTAPNGIWQKMRAYVQSILEPLRRALNAITPASVDIGMNPDVAMGKTFGKKFWSQDTGATRGESAYQMKPGQTGEQYVREFMVDKTRDRSEMTHEGITAAWAEISKLPTEQVRQLAKDMGESTAGKQSKTKLVANLSNDMKKMIDIRRRFGDQPAYQIKPGQEQPEDPAVLAPLLFQMTSENYNRVAKSVDLAFASLNSADVQKWAKTLGFTLNGSKKVMRKQIDDLVSGLAVSWTQTRFQIKPGQDPADAFLEELAQEKAEAPENGVETGETAPIIGQRGGIGRSAAHFFQRFFTTRGELPADVYSAKVRKEGRVAKEMNKLRFAAADFKRGVRKALGQSELTLAEAEQMNQVLRGEADITTVPEAVRQPLRAFRDHIDSLSRQLIADGVAQGDLVGIITEHMGVYATRSYRIFDDPKHRDKVPAGVRNRAIAAIREMSPEKSDAEVQGTLKSLLYRGAAESPVALLKGSRLGSKDLSIFMQRKDIPAWLRELWGEYKDPGVNYVRSVFKMAHLLANQQFLNEVRTAGLGTWLRSEEDGPIVNEYGDVITKLAADESSVMAPLNGLYTTPEIKAAFERMDSPGNLPNWLRVLMAVNYAVKYGKTVGSVMTHVRNVTSNAGFMVSNGHWRLDKSGKAIWATTTGMFKLSDPEFRAYYERLAELGLVGEDVRSGELKDALRDASKADMDEFLYTLPARNANRAVKAVRAGLRFMGGLYQAEDAVWKVYAWENEKERYSAAFPDWSPQKVEEHAASVVRDTYPTYSKIPEAIKAIRRFPLVGPFVSFPSEVVRTQFHTISLGLKEIQAPETRAIGAQRLVGSAIALGGLAVLTKGVMAALGIGGDDDDDLRWFVPSWQENSQFLYTSQPENATYNFVDLGYSDPHAYLTDPVVALMRSGDWQEKLWRATSEALSPFASEEILAGALMDLRSNEDEKIYNPHDTVGEQAKDMVNHLWIKALEPGTISSARRIYAAATGADPRLEVVPEVTALATGQRIQPVNVEHSLGFRVRDFGKALTEIQGIARKTATSRGKATGEMVATDLARMEKLRMAEFAEMQKILGAARRLGVPESNIQTLLLDSLPDEVAKQLLSGDYAPYEMTPQTIQQMMKARPEEFLDRFAGWQGDKLPEAVAEHAGKVVGNMPYQKPSKKGKTADEYASSLKEYEQKVTSSKQTLDALDVSYEQAQEALSKSPKTWVQRNGKQTKTRVEGYGKMKAALKKVYGK